VYPHMSNTSTRRAIFHERRISIGRIGQRAGHADSSDLGLLGKQSSQKNCNSLPQTPMNRRAQFDAASFILGGEISNRRKKTNTNSNRCIHTLPINMCGL